MFISIIKTNNYSSFGYNLPSIGELNLPSIEELNLPSIGEL